MPTSVVSMGGKYIYEDDQETPNTQIATFDFGDAELVFEVRGLPTGSEGNISQSGNTIGDLFYGSEENLGSFLSPYKKDGQGSSFGNGVRCNECGDHGATVATPSNARRHAFEGAARGVMPGEARLQD